MTAKVEWGQRNAKESHQRGPFKNSELGGKLLQGFVKRDDMICLIFKKIITVTFFRKRD